jgi:hypothetical protein
MSKPHDAAPPAERLKYYRDRAEETRTIAEMMTDPTAKASMMHQSIIWQRMADRLAENANEPAPSSPWADMSQEAR